MPSPLSMTTAQRKRRRRPKFLFRVRRSPDGELRILPIREEPEARASAGTITATMPSRIVAGDREGDVVSAVRNACGAASSVRGRLLTVDLDSGSVEAVGDVLDSFGCQWDFSEG